MLTKARIHVAEVWPRSYTLFTRSWKCIVVHASGKRQKLNAVMAAGFCGFRKIHRYWYRVIEVMQWKRYVRPSSTSSYSTRYWYWSCLTKCLYALFSANSLQLRYIDLPVWCNFVSWESVCFRFHWILPLRTLNISLPCIRLCPSQDSLLLVYFSTCLFFPQSF